MPLKAVLFDMDGVIVNTEPLYYKMYHRFLKELGIDEFDEDFIATFRGASSKSIYAKIIGRYHLEKTPAELETIKERLVDFYREDNPELELMPHAKELIEEYHRKGYKKVIASSSRTAYIDIVLKKFGLEPYFMAKVSGNDLKESKPNPEIFLIAAEKAGESKENCMVIEDATNGIIAANRAGIFCAGYDFDNEHVQDYSSADIVVADLRELYPDRIEKYF
ncbi:HAD family phosphatase [Weeksellaceae bacterium A-14]